MDKKFLFKLLFNIVETLVIFMIGLILKISPNIIIILMITFFLTRLFCGQPKHYNKWYRCFVWSALTFTSVYALSNLDLLANVLLTIFTGFIATGRADINDLYQWKGKSSNYADIDEFIKFHEFDDKLIEFENKLKEKDGILYLLYKYRFKENYTFNEIYEKTGLENPRIAEKLDKIAFSLRIYCGI